MFGSIADFISIIPFNKIEKVVYTIMSIQKQCSMENFEQIISKIGLKAYYKYDTGMCLYDNKNMDENKITVCGTFKNNSICSIESHFKSYIGTENISVANKYFCLYDEIENYISNKYGLPKTSVNNILKETKVPLINSVIESIEYRQKLIYSFKYETEWENKNFRLVMKMTPEFQIIIWPNGMNYI